MAQRRILLLNTDLEIGGTPTVVRELALRLRPFAHIEVACLKGRGPVADQLCDQGVTVTAFNASRWWHIFRSVRLLRNLIRDRHIDTVMSFLVHANAVAGLAMRDCPGVYGIQSIQTVQPTPAWHWRVQAIAQQMADKILVPSSAVVRAAGAMSGVSAEKCVVIPNAIDPNSYLPADTFQNPVIRVGYIGRLDPVKRPGLLISMMHSAADTVELHYFGDGRARTLLEAQAGKSRAHDRIKFHGTVASPQKALRQLDCLILPSPVEGFGLVLIEAMAAGVPVIACAAGGVLDVVQDGVNGCLIDPGATGDEAALYAASVEKLQAASPYRSKLIDGGFRTVREKFGWEVVLPQYRRFLQI